MACDPAMCAALAQHCVPPANLLVLGPGAGDPLGSDLVVRTAAVRTARLAASGGTARRMLAFLRAQRSPYQPGYAGTAGRW